MSSSLPLLIAEAEVRSHFQWGRIQSNNDWILPLLVLALVLLIVRWTYRRDAAELPAWIRWLLTALRATAFLGLLVLWLQPQWRSERDLVHNSRVLMVVDTSMSMNRRDSDSGASSGSVPTRLEQVAAGLDQSDLVERLRKIHDVSIYQFNNSLEREPLLTLPKRPPAAGDEAAAEDESPAPPAAGDDAPQPAPTPRNWQQRLMPAGTETRLGDSLVQLIQDQRNSPLSAIVLMSDGGQNAGVSSEAAIELAREAGIPLFAVGLGSDRRPTSVRVYDLTAPARAFPGDRYTVTGLVQGQGMAGRTVTVELVSREAGNGPAAKVSKEQMEATRQVALGGDGEVVPVKFELTPGGPGRRVLGLRIRSTGPDANDRDHFRETTVEIVDRKNKVLLMAGGPTRDYHFLRTLLYRDRATTVDVLLQTAQEGMSQESNKILDEFPTTREQMYAYDCLVAYDPNWQALKPDQIDLLESWVGEQGGGMVVAAGPVYAGRAVENWTQDADMTKVRGLYPVEFARRSAFGDTSVYTAREPWPLDFTRKGLEAEYLWLGDTAAASQQAWATLPGMYSVFPARGPKPGASVLANFSDPQTAQGAKQPVYFAEHFYGSGRVFYMGSGEMWRLRRVDPNYFEQFYTKLLRHVSQGRLLRGSSRGVLLVGQDHYLVGNTVDVRAQLTNARLEPLNQPNVGLQLYRDGVLQRTVTLTADPGRVGTFLGQFPVLADGDYRLELRVPESQEERLMRTIKVHVPRLEEENPQRNDPLLREIANKTGGMYYVGMASAVNANSPRDLVGALRDRSTTEIIPVAPNPKREEEWLMWMMVALCSVLCLEWLLRRIAKLA